ncbi:3-hydroxyethyl bacteriochlorophyllide a dehydrogenase [Palleronia aestuarii]|uniref:3-hydroxyethyl bacteriochlorophyllide a dehydrogenase n=1 Tax=Palleronia aestuarii TaxID=568105 RepID=A0A2W7NJF2_9RHOB|nr:chlorophyll synthesis pathway protein BchC [Palleronia aestuarii]PZX11422.1 3-hydroxyethyl bacteriochlorophyllide a dehydrogenase [Palleronia aestuarii]
MPDTTAILLDAPRSLSAAQIAIDAPGDGDLVVEIAASGISTGTEKLFWEGRMPPFPGMGYPLVPGYESVGEVVEARPGARIAVGTRVFVPGANCYGPIRGLFGGASKRIVTDAARVTPIDAGLGEDGALLALAATALHAVAGLDRDLPELIVGHGTLGRLLARITRAAGGAPVVWERDPARRGGAMNYEVIDPEADPRRDYATIFDASGSAALLPELIGRIAKGGEIVLAGFYTDPISFAFPPAFMKEARIRIAAEWTPDDMVVTRRLVESGTLSLAGLVTHRMAAADAAAAYERAFTDPACLKMILDWKDVA